MKIVVLLFGLTLFACNSGGPKYGQSSDDNSHLRNPQYPTTGKTFPKPDSIEVNDQILYKLDKDLMLNGMSVLGSFSLEKCTKLVGTPDSVHRGGPEIIAEFGEDDYELYFGKSYINAGHGQLLMMKIGDKNLKLSAIGVGSNRKFFERAFKFSFPKKDTVNCLGVGDDYYSFIFEDNTITAINYYAPPL